jgi:hypothetical protein
MARSVTRLLDAMRAVGKEDGGPRCRGETRIARSRQPPTLHSVRVSIVHCQPWELEELYLVRTAFERVGA